MYDTVVQPYVSKHEPTIDRGISELKERAWNLALSYWYKSADMSSKKVLECLQLLMAQAMNAALSRPQAQVPHFYFLHDHRKFSFPNFRFRNSEIPVRIAVTYTYNISYS